MQFSVSMLLLTVFTWTETAEPATELSIRQGSTLQANPERENTPAPMRTWTDASGRFRVEGTFYKLDSQTQYVGIQRPNGKQAWISIEKLSRPDQEYVFHTVMDSQSLGVTHQEDNAHMPLFDTAVLAKQPVPTGDFRYVYESHRGTQHLAGLRGTTVYYPHHKYTLAALAHFGDDGSGKYVLYRVDEHGLEQELWAFGKSAVSCYGFAVWRYYDSDQDGDFEWIFQSFAHRHKAHAP